jgi:hypothetical protein
MTTRPAILFYGNCQAGAVYQIFMADPPTVAAFDLLYQPSFDDPMAATGGISPDDAARAVALFEQFDPVPFPHRDRLPAGCAHVTFPAVDFNLLWPLTCVNPFNDPSPDIPWGRFPYGDRLIVDAVKRGLSAGAIWDYYRATSEEALPDPFRFAQLERARLAARDERCDIKLSALVFERFVDTNLFWCVNHPTLEMLGVLARQLVDAGSANEAIAAIDVEAAVGRMPSRGPLALITVPVHPAIARHFALKWYRGPGPHYGLGDATTTYDDYFKEMIACSIERRENGTVAT